MAWYNIWEISAIVVGLFPIVFRNWSVVTKTLSFGSVILTEILYNPVGRLGRVEDVANLVAFVTSPLAAYVNGANFRLDGGSTTCIN